MKCWFKLVTAVILQMSWVGLCVDSGCGETSCNPGDEAVLLNRKPGYQHFRREQRREHRRDYSRRSHGWTQLIGSTALDDARACAASNYEVFVAGRSDGALFGHQNQGSLGFKGSLQTKRFWGGPAGALKPNILELLRFSFCIFRPILSLDM